MKKFILIILILLMIIATAVFVFKNNKSKVKYKTEPVIKGTIVEHITASGTINPLKTTIIGSQISGPVKEIYVDYNSPVKKGQLLALIDPAILQSKVNEAKANLESSQAAYDKLNAILKNNERIMIRNKELYETDLIARIDYENAETEYLSTQAELFSAKAKISQAKALMDNALTNLEYTKIISPSNGIVISKDVEVGQTVAASFQTPTLFTVAEDLTQMQIDTNVSESDISHVKEGQSVTFTVDSYPEEVFRGDIIQIRNSPEIIQNVVTYFVIIKVKNDELKLKPGMTANVTIVTNKKNDIILVPNEALKFTPLTDKEVTKFEQQGIWIETPKKPKRISITTGISDDSYTEVTSGNLKPGQRVIVSRDDITRKKMDRPPRMRFF